MGGFLLLGARAARVTTLFPTLIERDADPLFLAPYHPALPDSSIGFDDQLKFVWDAEGRCNVEGRPRLR